MPRGRRSPGQTLLAPPRPRKFVGAASTKPVTPIEEQSLEALFAPLVQLQDWFGDEEKSTAARYQALCDAVQRLLSRPKCIESVSASWPFTSSAKRKKAAGRASKPPRSKPDTIFAHPARRELSLSGTLPALPIRRLLWPP